MQDTVPLLLIINVYGDHGIIKPWIQKLKAKNLPLLLRGETKRLGREYDLCTEEYGLRFKSPQLGTFVFQIQCFHPQRVSF